MFLFSLNFFSQKKKKIMYFKKMCPFMFYQFKFAILFSKLQHLETNLIFLGQTLLHWILQLYVSMKAKTKTSRYFINFFDATMVTVNFAQFSAMVATQIKKREINSSSLSLFLTTIFQIYYSFHFSFLDGHHGWLVAQISNKPN